MEKIFFFIKMSVLKLNALTLKVIANGVYLIVLFLLKD